MRNPAPTASAAAAALQQILVVLVRPQQPRNVGACARALKCMGLSRLALVAPRQFPDPQADQVASSALDVLATAAVHAQLPDALVGMTRVYGISARVRRQRLPLLSPRQLADEVLQQAQGGSVALLFGNEDNGLDNTEMAHCQAQVVITSAPECPSLNLGAAVQVLCYELRQAALALHRSPGQGQRQGATLGELEAFCAASDPVLADCGYYDNKDAAIARARLRALIDRARPDAAELRMLAGLLRQLRRCADRP